MPKNLYKGIFSYSYEIDIEYAYAYSKEQARVVMCRRLAKKHDVHPSHVLSLFNNDSQNYEIKIEMEVKEDG
jgi:hypothetical protein